MKFYTIRDLVDITKLSEWQLCKEVRAGRLRAVTRRGMERGYRVSAEELERWQSEEWTPVCSTPSPSSR